VIDAGTRVGRYLVGEFLGRASPRLANPNWLPGAALSTALVVGAWSYFIWTGSISTIWPMFGVANQLMASIALAVGTTVIINAGKGRYAWVTLLPLSFLSVTTLTAGWLDVTKQFWPMAVGPDASLHVQGVLQSVLTSVMMVCVVVILVAAGRKWMATGVFRRASLATAD
jgi:carbon starvation protein